MRFVLFVEGESEQQALPFFFQRWLNPQLRQPVKIVAKRFQGAQRLWTDTPKLAQDIIDAPNSADLLGVIAIVDLASELPFPDSSAPPQERVDWGEQEMERIVNREKFRHFFAVHELEAWLFCKPDVFHKSVIPDLNKKLRGKQPEEINDKKPPAKLLDELYIKLTDRDYNQVKVTTSATGFAKLDPAVAYAKCPSLRIILDEMLAMAQAAGA